MSDDSQIFVPPSFVAVHTLPGRIKPSLPAAELAQRYELCEDLAQMLAPQAGELQARLDAPAHEVLARMGAGLMATPDLVAAPEGVWVLRRLAELLDWPDPGPEILG